MWKIVFKYPEGGTVKLTNSKQPMDERLARKYHKQYGVNSDGGTYQKYPKKKYRPIALATVVDILTAGGDLENEILIEQEKLIFWRFVWKKRKVQDCMISTGKKFLKAIHWNITTLKGKCAVLQ